TAISQSKGLTLDEAAGLIHSFCPEVVTEGVASQTSSLVRTNAFSGPPLRTGQAAQDVVFADFNGDGNLDLVDLTGSSVVLRLLRSDSTVISTRVLTVGVNPFLGISADFNGDGKADLAVSNNGSGSGGSVSILLGNGDGSFQATRNFPVTAKAIAIA